MFIYNDVKVNYKFNFIGENDKTIVFLHGFGGSTKSFEYFFEKLKKDYNVLNLDFPPFGESSKPNECWDVITYCEMVHTLLCFLGIKKYNIVCHSFGGRVAICLASRYNEVDKLVFISSAGLKPKFSLKKKFKIVSYKIKKKLKLDISKYGSPDYKSMPDSMKVTFNKIVNFHQNGMVKNLKNETLLIWGKSDTETPIYMAKKFKKLIKNSKLILLDGDHFCYIKHKQLVLKHIKNFIGVENDIFYSN